MKKVIFAADYSQYIHCCHRNNLNPKHVPHITSLAQLEAIDEAVWPIFFGTSHPDNDFLEEAIRVMKSKGILMGGKHINLERRPPGELESIKTKRARAFDD